MMTPVRHALIAAAILFLTFTPGNSQDDDTELRAALDKIDKGLSSEVRRDLPGLVSRHPNNPGALYLQGRLAVDGIEAVKFYQGVVDNFPKSEWADDALFRIYQYYYSLGLYRTAEIKMQQLKKEYPGSGYLTGKPEQTIPAIEEKVVNLPKKEVEPSLQEATPGLKTDTLAQPVLKEDDKQTLPEKAFERSKSFTIQAGAYSTSANAEKQRKFFDELGYSAEIVNKVRNGKNLFLVWVGSYATTEEARLIVKELKNNYKVESMIVERY